LREILSTLCDPVSRSKNPDRLRTLLVRQVRHQAAKLPRSSTVSKAQTAQTLPSEAAPAEPEPPDLPARVAALQEPDRTAFALFHCFDGDTDRLAESIGLRVSKFSAAVLRARQTLEPSGTFPDCARLSLYRSWAKNSARIAKAVAADKEAGIDAQFAAQKDFDGRVQAELDGIAPPESVPVPTPVALEASGWRAALRQPALLAIAIAGLVMLGVAVFAARRTLDDFAGKDFVCELVADADEMSGLEMEQIKPVEAGKLGDWFVLKGFEDFASPPELSGLKALGCRVYEHEGHPIAQVALNRHNALLFVFHNASKKVRLKTGAWRIFQEDEWAVAARGDGVHCFVVAFLGSADEMQPLLNAGQSGN